MVTIKAVGAAAAVVVVVAAGVVYWEFDNLVPIVGLGVNYVRFFDAPKGTLTTERAGSSVAQDKLQDPVHTPSAQAKAADAATSSKDWPSYNKTLTSERFSELDQITKDNARGLSVLCTYDTAQYTGFNSGLLEIQGRWCSPRNTIFFRSIPIPARRIGASTRLTPRRLPRE